MLVASDIRTKIIGHQASINVRCSTDEITAIVGPNGAGKSTLLHALAAIEYLQSGSVTLVGKSLHDFDHDARAKRLALLSQFTPLCFDFLVKQVVGLGRYVHRDNLNHRHNTMIEQALTLVGMASFSDRPYASLSQGEQQRVQLARVLLQLNLAQVEQPSFLILDEPTAHLDLRVQHQICQLVKSLLTVSFR